MGIIDVKNILAESRPMFFITGLVGLRPVGIGKKKILGYIYVVLLLLAYHALHFYTIAYFIELCENVLPYAKSVNTRIILANVNPFFYEFMIISSVMSATKVRRLYDEINVIDEKLMFLEVRIDNGKSMRTDTARICDIMLFTILFNLLEYFPQRGPVVTEFFDLVWIIYTLPQFVNSIALVSFTIVMTKIQRRFEAINAIIPRMMIIENYLTSTLEGDMNNVYKLRLVNKVHGRLVKVATDFSEAYGSFLLASFVMYFLATGAHLRIACLVFGRIERMNDQVVETLCVLFYLGKFIMVFKTCHRVTLQAKLSGRLLREKWTDVDHHPLKQETDALIAQIESRNLQLTACNFFVIDYPALKTIIVSLVAYIIFVSHTANSCDKK